MASTLIIGIGTTGLSIIEEAQQLHYEFTGKNKPGKNVEYVYIETDESKKPRKTASGVSDIEQIDLNLKNAEVFVNQLRADKNLAADWVPDAMSILKGKAGAGGAPSFGRLAVWGHSNYLKLRSVIQKKYQDISGGDSTQILIVGSLTGGTGAGICIDVAYLVREITKNNNVNGLFVIPDYNTFAKNKTLFENSFSALTAIDFYEKGFYKTNWPDGTKIESQSPPFEFVQFLSSEFNDGTATLSNLTELIRVASTVTALQFFDTDKVGNYFYDLIKRRRIDSSVNNRIKNNLTAGFFMVQYPKAQLEELLALELISENIERFINPNEYVDRLEKKNAISTLKPTIKAEIDKKIEDFITTSFNILDSSSIGADTYSQKLKSDTDKIISKTHGKNSPERFLFDLFGTKQGGNYFEFMKRHSIRLKDSFIESTNKYIEDTTNTYKNLHVTSYVIETLGKTIQGLQKFYNEQYKITGNDGEWDKILQKYIDELLASTNNKQLFGIKKEFTQYALEQLSTLLKIHTLIPVLKQFEDDLISQKNTVKTINGLELPSTNKVSAILKSLADVIDGDNDEDGYTIKKRKNEIENVLDSYTTCFKMLYAFETRKKDLEIAYSNYTSNPQNKLSIEKLFNSNNVWKYLNSKEVDIYTDSVINAVNFVSEKKFVADNNIVDIIDKLKPNTNENKALLDMFKEQPSKIKERVPAMIRLKNDKYSFQDDPCAKLFILSSDHAELNNKLLKNYKIDPQNPIENTVDLPSLKNAIIFYQEYGYLGENEEKHFYPLQHIAYMENVKNYLRKLATQEFKLMKFPYLDLETVENYIS
jgi:hypothetical protein